MNFLFLMEPLETVKVEKDTSYIFMLGAQRRGHNVYYLADGAITLREGKVYFHVEKVIPQENAKMPFIRKETLTLSQDKVDCIFVRSDPPFDQTYLMNMWLLERLPSSIPVINKPSGICTVNEKIWATQFTALVPKTLVSRQKNEITRFLKAEKDIIVKPTDGFGGASVFHVKLNDDNANVIFETATERYTKEVILQKYIPESKRGDKRILLLNGEPLGAVLRLHAENDHRNNFFAGGKPLPISITTNDKKIIRALKPHLQALGLYFVGIDIIGKYLIEVNVTSPTCLQEINRFYKQALENQVIDFAEKLVKNHNKIR